VDFDPVTAKAEGRQPYGMSEDTASLFPAEYDEIGTRNIPKGWGVENILEFANLLSGGTPKTSVPEYWNGNVPWVSAKDISGANSLFLFATEKTISDLGVQKSNAKWLPAKTTVITARGTVGSYCLLGREMTMNQTNYGLKAKNGYGDYFVFFSLVFLVEQLQQNSYGTIFDTITTRTFQEALTIQPPATLANAFEKTIEPLMEMINCNTKQSEQLASIRDTLLPKLLSGEIRLKDAERLP
jgi:restriction endonuclease S subunit